MSAFDSHIQKFVSDFAHIGSILCIVPKKRKEKHDQSVRFTVRIDRVCVATKKLIETQEGVHLAFQGVQTGKMGVQRVD